MNEFGPERAVKSRCYPRRETLTLWQSANRLLISLVAYFTLVGTTTAQDHDQTDGAKAAATRNDKPTPIVKRAKRPVFTERDWDGIYFENLFRDGLVGPRPKIGADKVGPNKNETATTNSNQASSAESDPAGGWAEVVSREVLEDEVKRLQAQLDLDITTPVKFKTDYLKARQTFSMLSMWFAIIHQYPGEVRWKQYASIAQPAFWRAAANARTDSEQAFQNARARKDDLKELIRGGAFPDVEKPIEELDWSLVVDRVPMMTNLEVSFNQLKQLTANGGEFKANLEEVVHQSSLIAAIGRVLAQENMEGADDDDYVKLARAMSKNAVGVLDASKLSDFESVSKAVNQIEQSCNNCHADWR